jgi:hypothetical protein
VTDDEICSFLGAKVDPAEVKRRLGLASRRLGLRSPYTPEQVVLRLEELASGTGVIAIVARFAKARVLLSG